VAWWLIPRYIAKNREKLHLDESYEGEKKDNGNVKKDPGARKQRTFFDGLFGAINRPDFSTCFFFYQKRW